MALTCSILGSTSANAQWVDPNLAIIYQGAQDVAQAAKDDINFYRIQEGITGTWTDPNSGQTWPTYSYDDATEAELTIIGDIAASNYRGWTGEGIDIRITDGTDTVKDKIVDNIKGVAPDVTTTFTFGQTQPDIHTIFFDTYYNYAEYLTEIEDYNADQDWLDTQEGAWGSPRKVAKSEEDWTTSANNAQTYELLYPFVSDSELNQDERSQGKFAAVAAGNEGALCDSVLTCNKAAVINVAKTEASTAYWLGGDPMNGAVVVGALNKEGTALADYSNHAGILKDNFLVTTISPFYSTNSWTYERHEGTEFAAAQVAGAAALIMEKYGVTQGQTIKNILFNSADDLGEPGVDDVYGHGALNIGRALSPYGPLN